MIWKKLMFDAFPHTMCANLPNLDGACLSVEEWGKFDEEKREEVE